MNDGKSGSRDKQSGIPDEHVQNENESKAPPDPSIFDKDKNDCNSDYTKCEVMKRLLAALNHYSTIKMNSKTPTEHDEALAHFVNNVYEGLVINDYIHFKDNHEHQLQQINDALIESNSFMFCEMTKCDFTSRHHQTCTEDTQNTDDNLDFYTEIFDGLHFHLYHCFEAGLRTKQSNEEDQIEDDDEHKDNPHFDREFARMNRQIVSRQHATSSFDRYHLSSKHNKFNILAANNVPRTNSSGDEIATYLDELMKNLLKLNFDDDHLTQFSAFIKEQQYDSEAIDYDHGLKPNGFVSECIRNENQLLWNECDDFITDLKMESSSFIVGFRFYYWPFYNNPKAISETVQHKHHVLDHSGYTPQELFVVSKYDSFKEEAMHYKYLSAKQYKAIVTKVQKYLDAEVFKKTTATPATHYIYYGIKIGDPICFDHLLALILYTDFDTLSSDFSMTFRKNNKFETIKSVIKRNREYYWMSKRLRECVEVFGQWNGNDAQYGKKGRALKGPYYSGMSVVMNMPSFNMRLCSPTSTSQQIEIAMKFSGANGIVIQLNIPIRSQTCRLHGFNASWASRYKEEDERLFIGGLWYIQIESILIKSTKQNFEKSIHCLYYLDVILSGGRNVKKRMPNDEVFIIECLMNGSITEDIDDYIYSTFAQFVRCKKEITFDLENLRNTDERIMNLMLHKYDRKPTRHDQQRLPGDLCNIFKSEILEVFKNVRSVIIRTTNISGKISFSFSMTSLLSWIESSRLQKVTVQATVARLHAGRETFPNWMRDLWNSSSESLKKQYKSAYYDLSFSQEKQMTKKNKKRQKKTHVQGLYQFVINSHPL